MNAEQFSSALGKVNDKYIMEAITYKKEKRSGWLKWGAMVACFGLILTAALVTLPGILKGTGGVVPPPAPDPGPVISSENNVIHEPEQYTAIAWEDVPSIEPFGPLFPTEVIEGYELENDIALYSDGAESVLHARFYNGQLGDELVVTVYVKGLYGEELLNEVIYGDGHSFKGSMIVIDSGDYVVRYFTKRDIMEITGFEDMVKSAQCFSSWSMPQYIPDKGSAPIEYPDTTIIPGFDLDEPSEPDSP